MSTPAADLGTTVPSEVTGLVTAQTYAAGMTRAYTDIAEHTARFAAGLSGQGVHGAAVAAVTHAQAATQAAGAAWAQAATALHRQTAVREAYTATPDAGGKTFLTSTSPEPAPDRGTDPAATPPPDGARVQLAIAGADGAHVDLSLPTAEAWALHQGVTLAIVRAEHPQVTAGCPSWCVADHTAGNPIHTGEFVGPAWSDAAGARAIVRPELTSGGTGQLRLAVTGTGGARAELVLAVPEAHELRTALGDAAPARSTAPHSISGRRRRSRG